MKATTFYRASLILGTGAYAYYWLLPYSSAPVDPNLEGLLYHVGDGAKIQLNEVQSWMLFVAWILAAMGMFFFMKYARQFFVTLLVIGTAMSPFLGLTIETGVEQALLGVVTLANGVVVAMAYFSPVKDKFMRPAGGRSTHPPY